MRLLEPHASLCGCFYEGHINSGVPFKTNQNDNNNNHTCNRFSDSSDAFTGGEGLISINVTELLLLVLLFGELTTLETSIGLSSIMVTSAFVSSSEVGLFVGGARLRWSSCCCCRCCLSNKL